MTPLRSRDADMGWLRFLYRMSVAANTGKTPSQSPPRFPPLSSSSFCINSAAAAAEEERKKGVGKGGKSRVMKPRTRFSLPIWGLLSSFFFSFFSLLAPLPSRDDDSSGTEEGKRGISLSFPLCSDRKLIHIPGTEREGDSQVQALTECGVVFFFLTAV